ncbi:hypothetical protein SAMN03159511_0665 [Pseudomonas sp. NFACC19-2]|nr:hypothetical protein [Pseudomonas sp. NFACC19-2]SFW13232.1 hypothetical protein SAMN03159511_0665 [Pseudomonas sp. NFACC19-2]
MTSSTERERRLAAARYARATMALEGARQTPVSMEQIEHFVAGEISIEKAIENARKDYGLPACK